MDGDEPKTKIKGMNGEESEGWMIRMNGSKEERMREKKIIRNRGVPKQIKEKKILMRHERYICNSYRNFERMLQDATCGLILRASSLSSDDLLFNVSKPEMRGDDVTGRHDVVSKTCVGSVFGAIVVAASHISFWFSVRLIFHQKRCSNYCDG